MSIRDTYKNKLYAFTIIILGVISRIVTGDATFLLLMLIIGVPLFFSKENYIT